MSAPSPSAVPTAPTSDAGGDGRTSGSSSTSSSGRDVSAAASLEWNLDWRHRYGVSTDPLLLPSAAAPPQPSSPSETPPIEKREAIDDSGGDGEQRSSIGGSGSVESGRSHVHAPPPLLLPRPRSETKGAIMGSNTPTTDDGVEEADVMSEGPAVAADESPVVMVATPMAGRPGVCAAAVPAVGGGEWESSLLQQQPPRQQPPTALPSPSHPSIGEEGGSGGASSVLQQRSESGGERQPLPHAKAFILAPQQHQHYHHVKNPSLASTLTTVSSSLSSSTTSSSSLPPRSKQLLLPHRRRTTGNVLEDELAVAPGKEDALLPKQRRLGENGSVGLAPYPGGFPSLQLMARRLAEDSLDGLDSRELLAIDWELRYGVSESLAGPSSASPSPTPAFHLQQRQLQEEEQNAAAVAAAAASAAGPPSVYLHAFPTTERQPSPPHSVSAVQQQQQQQQQQRTCEHCEEQPASMACPSCNDAAYCVECDTVLHRAVKLRSHLRRRLNHTRGLNPPTPGAIAYDSGGAQLRRASPTGEGGGTAGGLLNEEQHLEIDRQQIRMLAKLGEGYFGIVFRGLWAGQSVAVKKLKHGTRRQVEEFRNEVRVLARLRHPNITTFYGVTAASPEWLIVTELLHGSLYRLLHSQSAALPLPLQMRIAKDIACGAAYIHGLDPPIVHRDLNSSNVLLTGDVHTLVTIVQEGRSEPVAKLSDFGLSRSVERCMTACTGNAYYLAPEVFRGQHYTEKADCYSYAILLWELFTRQYPFGHLNPRSAAFQQAEGLRPPIEQETSVPPPVVTIMTQAWDAAPEHRPPFRAIVRAWEGIERALLHAHGGAHMLPTTTVDALLLVRSGQGPLAEPQTREAQQGNRGSPPPPLLPSSSSGVSSNNGGYYLMTPMEFRQQHPDGQLQRRPGLAALVKQGLVGQEKGASDDGGVVSPLPQTFYGYDVAGRYLHQHVQGEGEERGGKEKVVGHKASVA